MPNGTTPHPQNFPTARPRTQPKWTPQWGPYKRRREVINNHILAMAAETVGDLETVRIASENRLRSLTDPELFGLTLHHPDVLKLSGLVEGLKDLESEAIKHLQKCMKSHPMGAFVQSATGIGLKQGARLLVSIGDPYWNDLHERPRTVSELWAFCGMHVKEGHAVHRSKGVQSNWSPEGRMRVWLIAQSCIKTKGKYRDVYDAGRVKYEDATHRQECKRCGPKGKPAQPGSPISLGHQHARATRLICKEVLKDLWIEARRLHGEQALAA